MFRDGVRRKCGSQPHGRGFVARSGDHTNVLRASMTHLQIAFDEFLNLAASLTDQRNHGNVGVGVSSHHAEQGAFAHAGSRDDRNSLSLADRQQTIDGANAKVQRLGDGATTKRIHCVTRWQNGHNVLKVSESINRMTQSVQNPAQNAPSDFELMITIGARDRCADGQSLAGAQRHHQRATVGQANYFCEDRRLIIHVHAARFTDASIGQNALDHHSNDSGHTALILKGIGLADRPKQLLEVIHREPPIRQILNPQDRGLPAHQILELHR